VLTRNCSPLTGSRPRGGTLRRPSASQLPTAASSSVAGRGSKRDQTALPHARQLQFPFFTRGSAALQGRLRESGASAWWLAVWPRERGNKYLSLKEGVRPRKCDTRLYQIPARSQTFKPVVFNITPRSNLSSTLYTRSWYIQNKLRGLSPQASYTDRAIALVGKVSAN
jgi:hypothetical protein